MFGRFPALAIVSSSALLALAACGSDPKSPHDPRSIQELTGLASPDETAEAQEARSRTVVMNGDSLILTTAHVETSHPEIPALIVHSECSGPRCELFEPLSGDIGTMGLDDIEFLDGPAYTVGSRYGITLMSAFARPEDEDRVENASVTSYGSWMEHGGFGLQTNTYETGGVSFVERFGIAGGKLTGAKLAGGATWLGLMVGTLAEGEHSGDLLQGDAALNYDLALDTLDVGFSGIKNIDRRAAHSTEVVMFNDLAVAPDGTFKAGSTGDLIQGGFYGPAHAEAAGVFERSNIIGAFGAKREPGVAVAEGAL